MSIRADASQLESLPRIHPAHPYTVPIFHIRSGQLLHTMYVRASSPERARVTAAVHYADNYRRKGQRFRTGTARPDMPVELNQYWNYTNHSNPEGLMLCKSRWAGLAESKP